MNTLKSKSLSAAFLLLAAALSANANTVTFDFYKLGKGVANGDFLPTGPANNNAGFWYSTGGDITSSDVDNNIFNGDLNYTSGGVTVTATATSGNKVAAVVQDRDSGWNTLGGTSAKGAGLGVYHSKITSDDNVTTGEMLTLTFDRNVTVTQIGLRSEGHNTTQWLSNSTFLFNSNSLFLPRNLGYIDTNSSGSVFTFAYGGQTPDQFYISSITASVPDSGSTIAFMGLALIGLASLRRKIRLG